MWKLMGLLGMVLCAGCVEDFKEGGEDFANGCMRGEGNGRTELGIGAEGSPFCATVAKDTVLPMRRDTSLAACRLRGGTSDGVKGVPNSKNWIEVNTDGGAPLAGDASFEVATDGGTTVIPFYCEEDAALAGAIFVGAQSP